MKKEFRLGVIGGGFMASAIIDGAIKNFLKPNEIAVCEPDLKKRVVLAQKGLIVTTDVKLVAEKCDYLLFAVKPQVFPEVAVSLEGAELPVVLSIMAGKTIEEIKTRLHAQKICRIMPNLPCSVGEGMTAMDVSELSDEEGGFVYALFSTIGKVKFVQESALNAVTGVSGSGPAYVYLFLKSLVDAGVQNGLTQDESFELALQTLKGGVKMVESFPEKSLQDLIDAVSSKGGTTVAALTKMEEKGFSESIKEGVFSAVKRAEELSEWKN